MKREDKPRSLTVALPATLFRALKIAAAERDTTLTALVIAGVESQLAGTRAGGKPAAER